jgi:hypothetical protein
MHALRAVSAKELQAISTWAVGPGYFISRPMALKTQLKLPGFKDDT